MKENRDEKIIIPVPVLKLKLEEGVKPPEYQTAGASGFDIASNMDTIVPAGETVLIKTGISSIIPKGYEIQIRPRSGLAYKYGITVLNAPGTLDEDYRGDWGVLLYNTSKNDFSVVKGDRIAQAVLQKVPCANIVVVSVLDDTERGDGGFGHTGV